MRERILTLHLLGHSTAAIAVKLGLSRKRVTEILKARGYEMTRAEHLQWVKDRLSSTSILEIFEKL